jgi:AbrB family looped-hinge helix DNA binding protein
MELSDRYKLGIIINTLNTILPSVVKMEIVTVDNAGRLVIPEFIRKKLHLTKNVPLLITDLDDDKILIKKLDRNEIEKRLREELKGVEIDKIASEVRTEINEVAKKKYAAILG